jgi:hypothetical protein
MGGVVQINAAGEWETTPWSEFLEEVEPLFHSASEGGVEALLPAERKVHERLMRYNRNRNRKVAARMAWPLLVKAEPRLAEVERALAGIVDTGDTPSFCANAHWYGYSEGPSYRDRVKELAGWLGEMLVLRSEAAYDLAYEYLYELLPGCRDCQCA